MKTYFKLMIIPFLVLFLLSGVSIAAPFGTDITISDGNFNNTKPWYSDREDNEVEPGMAIDQGWDLEGFFIDRNILTMVGGYDFLNGNSGFMSGDIFIDVDGKVKYGDIHADRKDGVVETTNIYGYDYVLDLNFADSDYKVFAIDDTATLETAHYNENEGSSPWRYIKGGTEYGTGRYNDTFQYLELAPTYWGDLEGDSHYALRVDLGFLGPDIDNFIAHYTMECGNDNLMGSTAPVPEPATLLLFGTGLIGLAGVGRKKFKK